MPVLSNDLIEREKALSGTIEKYAKLFEIDSNIFRPSDDPKISSTALSG